MIKGVAHTASHIVMETKLPVLVGEVKQWTGILRIHGHVLDPRWGSVFMSRPVLRATRRVPGFVPGTSAPRRRSPTPANCPRRLSAIARHQDRQGGHGRAFMDFATTLLDQSGQAEAIVQGVEVKAMVVAQRLEIPLGLELFAHRLAIQVVRKPQRATPGHHRSGHCRLCPRGVLLRRLWGA